MNQIKSNDIEIRLNPIGKFEKCSICGDYDEEFEICSNKIGLPEIFLSKEISENAWVCCYCAGSYSPQLKTLLKISKTIERFGFKLSEKWDNFQEIVNWDLAGKTAIKIDVFPKDIDKYGNAKCPVCDESYFYEEISEYAPIPPNLTLDGEIVCDDCGEKYVPRLALLILLSYEAKLHCNTLYFKNDNPVKNVKKDRQGWITCPNCQKRFSTNDYQRWRYNRHLTCGQKIKIVSDN